MKNFFALSLVAIALLTSCNSGIKSDIDDLDSRVAALEQSKTVVGVRFVNTQMVLTYSTSETETLNMPEGLNGLNGTNGTNGANGADGTGIKTISFDQTTNLLTIVLSNNNESVFKIINDGYANMVAMLVSDTNGKMYVSEVTMGAIPIATISYDDNFNITSMLSKTFYDEQILKNFEVNKLYTGGILTSLQYNSYALEKGISYESEYFNTVDTVNQINSSDYYIPNNDSTYRYYRFDYTGTDGNHFTIFKYTVKHISNSYTSVIPYYAKYDENTAYHFSGLKSFSETSGGITTYTNWYYIDYKYIKTGAYNVGDIKNTESVQVECNSNGNPEKVHISDELYAQITYGDGSLISKGELYAKDEAGTSWIKQDKYLSFEYNESKLLKSVWMIATGNDPVEVFRTVYDKNGNPVEIYSISDEVTSYYDYFNPFVNSTDPWEYGEDVVYEDNSLQLLAKIEYDYSYKNFFGNTVGALVPVLQNYKVFNAPIKVSYAKGMSYGWMEYGNFNDSGYPEAITCNIYSNGGPKGFNSVTESEEKSISYSNFSVELSVSYITKQ